MLVKWCKLNLIYHSYKSHKTSFPKTTWNTFIFIISSFYCRIIMYIYYIVSFSQLKRLPHSFAKLQWCRVVLTHLASFHQFHHAYCIFQCQTTPQAIIPDHIASMMHSNRNHTARIKHLIFVHTARIRHSTPEHTTSVRYLVV